jgi:hypothetical protein
MSFVKAHKIMHVGKRGDEDYGKAGENLLFVF